MRSVRIRSARRTHWGEGTLISLFDIFRILANDAVKIPGAPSTARGWQIVRSFSDSQAADAARYFRTANIIGTAMIERTVHYWQSHNGNQLALCERRIARKGRGE